MLGAVLRIIVLSVGLQTRFPRPRQREIRIEFERLVNLFDCQLLFQRVFGAIARAPADRYKS